MNLVNLKRGIFKDSAKKYITVHPQYEEKQGISHAMHVSHSWNNNCDIQKRDGNW